MSEADGESGSFDTRLWVNNTDRDWVNSQKRGSETQADVISHLTALHDALEALAGDVPRNPSEEELRDALDTPRPESGTEAVDADALADAVAERVVSEVQLTIDGEGLADAITDELSPGMNAEDVQAAAERGAENALENIR